MTEPTADAQLPGESVVADSAISLQDDLVRGIQEALDSGALEKAGEMLDGLHSADVADVLHLVGPDHRRLLVELVRAHLDADVLVVGAREYGAQKRQPHQQVADELVVPNEARTERPASDLDETDGRHRSEDEGDRDGEERA